MRVGYLRQIRSASERLYVKIPLTRRREVAEVRREHACRNPLCRIDSCHRLCLPKRCQEKSLMAIRIAVLRRPVRRRNRPNCTPIANLPPIFRNSPSVVKPALFANVCHSTDAASQAPNLVRCPPVICQQWADLRRHTPGAASEHVVAKAPKLAIHTATPRRRRRRHPLLLDHAADGGHLLLRRPA